MADWFLKVKKDFITCFLEKDRWHYILQGLGNTLKIALVAVLLGVVIGTVVAIIRSMTCPGVSIRFRIYSSPL